MRSFAFHALYPQNNSGGKNVCRRVITDLRFAITKESPSAEGEALPAHWPRRLINAPGPISTPVPLAKRMGLPQYRLNRLLNGHPFPRLSELQRFGETLNLSLPYLLGISEKGQSDLTPRQREVLSRYQAIDTGTRLIVDKILDIKSSK